MRHVTSMKKQVDGDTWSGMWDALTSTGPFEVCYDELFDTCYSVPGWGSWGALLLFITEVVFWVIVSWVLWKRSRKGEKDGRYDSLRSNDQN